MHLVTQSVDLIWHYLTPNQNYFTVREKKIGLKIFRREFLNKNLFINVLWILGCVNWGQIIKEVEKPKIVSVSDPRRPPFNKAGLHDVCVPQLERSGLIPRKTQNHRKVWLEGTFKPILFHPHFPLSQAAPSLVQPGHGHFRDGAASAVTSAVPGLGTPREEFSPGMSGHRPWCPGELSLWHFWCVLCVCLLLM